MPQRSRQVDWAWCAVCGRSVRTAPGLLCQHLFTTPEGLNGAGAPPQLWQQCRESFHALLDATGLGPDIADAIMTGHYHLGRCLEGAERVGVYFSVWSGDPLRARSLGRSFADCLSGELSESLRLGLLWFLSLDKGLTPEANAVTLDWVRTWVGARCRPMAMAA